MRGADEDLTLQPPTKVPQRRPQVSDQDVTQNSDDVSPSNQTSTARSVKTSASVSTEKSKKSYHRKAASHPGAEFVFSDEEDSKGLIKEGRGSFELSGPTTIPPSSTPSPFINYTTEQVGAERVPGLVKNEEETVVSDMPTVSTMTASTLSNLIGPQLVAELAPDEEDVAARVAARITDDIQARLKEEIRAQLQTQDIAQAITVEAESYHGKEKSAATGDGADRDFICGLSQRTFIIVISCIVLFCGVFGGVMAAISGGGGDSANPVVPTASPTLAPTGTPTMAPTPSPTDEFSIFRRVYLLETLGSQIAPNNSTEEWALFEDPLSAQFQAIRWMASVDEYSAEPEKIDERTLLERYALAVLYFATSGSNWASAISFLDESTSVCQWNNGVAVGDAGFKGVYCTDSSNFGTVTYVTLSSLGLSGAVPWEVALLENMRIFTLENNALSGSLPLHLFNLTQLTGISFQSNALSGMIPSHMPPQLEELLMGDNMISGTLHADWSESLTNLRTLSLGANSIEGFIPLEWVGFSSLTQLDLQDNHLVGAIPPSLATMSHLMYLFVQNNRLTGTLPSELGDLSELQQCKLQNNPGLNGSVPESFSNLESLTVFLMENTTLTGSIDSLFCNTPNPPTLGADCLGSTPELECTCCEYCCSADGATCEGLTEAPTAVPSVAPTDVPTTSPSAAPTRAPTTSPTRRPTPAPVLHPTDAPVAPVPNPTPAPVAPPTGSPTRRPTPAPVPQPTPAPVAAPTPSPTRRPTRSPTESPTRDPTSSPTRHPTPSPTRSPTKPPTRSPTRSPTRRPTPSPTASPTANPTPGATIIQTIYPFKYTEYKGEITKDQPISVLSSLDLSGTDRGWDYYMEMTAGSDSYWELSFSSKLSVSSGHGLNNIQSISVRMNTIGQAKRHQHRQFYIYNDETSSWTWIGENTEENAWTWLDLTMTVPTSNGGYSDYFNSNNEVEIMIDSDNNDDVSNIDYLAITVHL